MNRDEEQLIRERAYEIWEREGRPTGRAEEHWRQAAAEIAAATKQPAAAEKPAPAPPPTAPGATPAAAPPRRSRPVQRREGNGATTGRRKPEAP
jgi:hypothetical protein